MNFGVLRKAIDVSCSPCKTLFQRLSMIKPIYNYTNLLSINSIDERREDHWQKIPCCMLGNVLTLPQGVRRYTRGKTHAHTR